MHWYRISSWYLLILKTASAPLWNQVSVLTVCKTENEKDHCRAPTSSLVEEMASRMTPCTSSLLPRLPLLPTSPRHSRARTRAESGARGFFTWREERRGETITPRQTASDVSNCDAPPAGGRTQCRAFLWGRRSTERPRSGRPSGRSAGGWRWSQLTTADGETDRWETSAADWGEQRRGFCFCKHRILFVPETFLWNSFAPCRWETFKHVYPVTIFILLTYMHLTCLKNRVFNLFLIHYLSNILIIIYLLL